MLWHCGVQFETGGYFFWGGGGDPLVVFPPIKCKLHKVQTNLFFLLDDLLLHELSGSLFVHVSSLQLSLQFTQFNTTFNQQLQFSTYIGSVVVVFFATNPEFPVYSANSKQVTILYSDALTYSLWFAVSSFDLVAPPTSTSPAPWPVSFPGRAASLSRSVPSLHAQSFLAYPSPEIPAAVFEGL